MTSNLARFLSTEDKNAHTLATWDSKYVPWAYQYIHSEKSSYLYDLATACKAFNIEDEKEHQLIGELLYFKMHDLLKST